MIVRPSRRSAGVSLSHYNDLFKQSSCPLACRNRLCGVDGGPVEATLRCRRSGGILASAARGRNRRHKSEEHTSALQSLMRISYAVFCLKKQKKPTTKQYINI